MSCGGRLPAPTIETPSRPLILLVDDDPVVQLTLARALTERGYDVCTAADGQAAMSYWRRSEPAIRSTRKGRVSGGSLPFASLGFMTVDGGGIRWIVRRGGRGLPPDSWTRLDVSACQRLADPRELTLASPRRLTRHILYRDGPAPILKAYRPSKAVPGSAPGGFSTRHPPNRELCPVELPGLLPRPPHGLPRAAAAFSGSMSPARGSVSVSA